MSYLNHCRLCLQPIPDSVNAANVYTKLSDGVPLAEHLDNLFDVLVGDYTDGDDLKLVCSPCVALITKCATGEASDTEAEAIGQRFQSMEAKACTFVRAQKLQTTPGGGGSLNASTNSAFGMTTPKAAVPHPVSASTGNKRPAAEPLSLEWLLSQPSSSGTSRYGSHSEKKIIVREIQLDEDDDDDDRETVIKTKCPFCKMVYVRHTALIKHIANIHPEKNVKFKNCAQCARNFLNTAELKAHKCTRRNSGNGFFWRRRHWWW